MVVSAQPSGFAEFLMFLKRNTEYLKISHRDSNTDAGQSSAIGQLNRRVLKIQSGCVVPSKSMHQANQDSSRQMESAVCLHSRELIDNSISFFGGDPATSLREIGAKVW
jgi:hypothetical protein